tara:strand:- start:3 stop:470 length:468 start_codon:yes stop_codon:yes gene_type:complete
MTASAMPAIFTFSFNLDPDFHDEAAPADPPHKTDEEHNVTYAFAGEIRSEDINAVQSDIDAQAEWYEEIFADREGAFGVHDWVSGPDERVICLGGYSSYEVEPARVRELMNSWRAALLATPQMDASFGPVVQIPNDPESDWEAYQAALAAGARPE